MNNALIINMTEAIACLTTTIFATALLLPRSHDLPKEEVMYFQYWQLAGIFHKIQPDFSKVIKIPPTG